MELALRYLGIGPGDEVITSAYTFTASASAISHVGATIVLADIEPDSYHLSLDSVAACITPRTKAIIPVDIGGVMVNYDELLGVARATSSSFRPESTAQEALGRVAIVADAAHSLGSQRNGRFSGDWADFTCFSFHAVKNLTTGEGGAVTWRPLPNTSDDDIYRYFMLASLHGQTKDALAKSGANSWEYDILFPGYKCNMTDIQAALGLGQLARYESMVARRHCIIAQYDAALADLEVVPLKHVTPDQTSNGHLYMVDLCGRGAHARAEVIRDLAEHQIAANVHFKPLPLLTAYRNLGVNASDYPNSIAAFENEITLPLFSTMTDTQVEAVARAFTQAIQKQS
jgi:dTDP-4-amino-4,6-dideoxygalactose transaminase